MRLSGVVTWCAALVALPTSVGAQFSGLEKVLSDLGNVAGFWVYAGFLPNSSVLTGGRPGAPPKQSGLQGPGLALAWEAASAGVDSGARMRLGAHERAPLWAFELALAYSQLSGFRSQNPTFDLRGSIQELPRLAFFGVWRPERRFSPYLGLHMGWVKLQSVAIYDSSGALYPVGGSTWEVGAALGLAANFHAGGEWFSAFVEPGYTLRNILGLDWSGQNSKTIPARFPRSLRFTGWEIAAGLEFRVPHGEKKDDAGKDKR